MARRSTASIFGPPPKSDFLACPSWGHAHPQILVLTPKKTCQKGFAPPETFLGGEKIPPGRKHSRDTFRGFPGGGKIRRGEEKNLFRGQKNFTPCFLKTRNVTFYPPKKTSRPSRPSFGFRTRKARFAFREGLFRHFEIFRGVRNVTFRAQNCRSRTPPETPKFRLFLGKKIIFFRKKFTLFVEVKFLSENCPNLEP